MVCYAKQAVPSLLTLLFPHKTAYFLNDSCDSYKRADENPKFHINKFNPF